MLVLGLNMRNNGKNYVWLNKILGTCVKSGNYELLT